MLFRWLVVHFLIRTNFHPVRIDKMPNIACYQTSTVLNSEILMIYLLICRMGVGPGVGEAEWWLSMALILTRHLATLYHSCTTIAAHHFTRFSLWLLTIVNMESLLKSQDSSILVTLVSKTKFFSQLYTSGIALDFYNLIQHPDIGQMFKTRVRLNLTLSQVDTNYAHFILSS